MKVIVVGAGPAGMMCAGVAAESGNQVILLEKNEKAEKIIYYR
jgi:predicted flavoprotein YhiN